jgi:hypothetical protein
MNAAYCNLVNIAECIGSTVGVVVPEVLCD